MIRRHPHIFLEERANNDIKSIDKVLEKWENIKERESGDKTRIRHDDRRSPSISGSDQSG